MQAVAVMRCSVKLTLVSGQGALVAVDSMRRKRSQYSSHALSADRYWLLVPSGVSCQNCLQKTDAAIHQVSHEARHCDATNALVVGEQEDRLREAAQKRRHG